MHRYSLLTAELFHNLNITIQNIMLFLFLVWAKVRRLGAYHRAAAALYFYKAIADAAASAPEGE
jgi:hypothetical protein